MTMDGGTINALLLFSGIALMVSVVVFLDWYGRRKDRESRRPRN
jgi:hypothetical protein